MRDAPPSRVREAIASALGRSSAATRWTRTDRSALNAIFRLDVGNERWFVKLGRADTHESYEAEAAGLRALAAADAVRVPGVMGVGEAADHAWLALEWLDLDTDG